jgi:hypothetical protein
MNSYLMLAALQRFLERRRIALEQLTATSMVTSITDWYREEPVAAIEANAGADVLVYRYGAWSEGCATGFKLSLLRRATETKAGAGKTDWFAGITVLFDPSRYTEIEAFSVVSSEMPSLDAFIHAIEDSPAFKLSVVSNSMGAMLESGGMR